MGFNVALAVGWEGGQLRTTPTFWASATGSTEAGGAVRPEMGGPGGGWFPGSVRCPGVGGRVRMSGRQVCSSGKSVNSWSISPERRRFQV